MMRTVDDLVAYPTHPINKHIIVREEYADKYQYTFVLPTNMSTGDYSPVVIRLVYYPVKILPDGSYLYEYSHAEKAA